MERYQSEKNPLMVAHIEAMETTRQSLVAIKAEQEAINLQLESLKEERAKVQASLRELDEEMEESLKKSLTEANETFKQSVSEINRKIMNTEKAHAKLKKRNEEELSQSLAQEEKLEQLELRKEQSRQFVDVHNSRVQEHTTREIQRIISEHGLDDPTIELSEGENNLIRIHIEE